MTVPKNFAKFTGKHLCRSLFFNKETPTQVFSCEICEIFKNTYFVENLRTAAFAIRYYIDKKIVFINYLFVEKTRWFLTEPRIPSLEFKKSFVNSYVCTPPTNLEFRFPSLESNVNIPIFPFS